MAVGEKPKFYSYVSVFGRYRGSRSIPAGGKLLARFRTAAIESEVMFQNGGGEP
jgi:hypothetical protein